jgi:hypothetical protein
MTPTPDQLRWYHAQLQAHDSGCRLRYYDWWTASAAHAAALRRFIALMTLGTVAWGVDYARDRWMAEHVNIEMAMPGGPLAPPELDLL